MNKNIFFTLVLLFIVSAHALFTSCNSCTDRRAGDTSNLPGVYRGEATIVLPAHVKAMLDADSTARTLVPRDPVPCSIRIKADSSQTLSLELENFTMPVRGITLDPATAEATVTDATTSLKGNGNVNVGSRVISYTHEGTIKNDSLNLNITVSIIPFVVEPKIVFKGKKTATR